jgi:hypothetical protein
LEFASELIHKDSSSELTLRDSSSELTLKDSSAAPRFNRRLVAGVALGVVAIALITAGVYWKDRWQVPAAAAGGSLRIESDPAGAEVRLNGATKGKTPLSLSVPAGSYSLSVRNGSNIKELPVSVTDGATTVHYITWADTAAPVPGETGNLSVATDPPAGDVMVDGQTRGAAPLTLRDLPVGQHRVVVRAGGSSYTRTVQIEAGTTASLFFGRQPGSGGAWIDRDCLAGAGAGVRRPPIDRDERHGPASCCRSVNMLSNWPRTPSDTGRRGPSVSRPAQTVALAVDLPRAPLSINAIPWAEVFIDGTRVGETPLGNLPQTLGAHEIVFRHPQLGERRINAMVTLKETARISVDMRQR